MAEPTAAERKAQLIQKLDRERRQFSRDFAKVREDANVPAHLQENFRRNKAPYLLSAAGLGWLLSFLAGRRRKALPAPKSRETIKQVEKGGILLMVLRFAFTVFRPALTAFITKKVAEYGNRAGWS